VGRAGSFDELVETEQARTKGAAPGQHGLGQLLGAHVRQHPGSDAEQPCRDQDHEGAQREQGRPLRGTCSSHLATARARSMGFLVAVFFAAVLFAAVFFFAAVLFATVFLGSAFFPAGFLAAPRLRGLTT
jgi:hypothetical protein